MAYISDAHRTIHLVSGASLPREVLISYKDDDDQTKLAVRGLWQALHIYGQCWLQTEPLEQGSELYKCRFSASRDFLYSKDSSPKEGLAFLYLLPRQQVLNIMDAPIMPIDWHITLDEEGNEFPVNVAVWNKDLWQLEGDTKTSDPSHTQTCEGNDDDRVVKQPEQTIAQKPLQDKPKELTAYKERKAEEPVDTYYEQVAKATIHEVMKEFYPEQIAAGQMPPRKYLPLILIKSVQTTFEHQLEHERDPRQRTALQQRIENLDLMIQKEKLWYWDRERYVKALWTDELTGVCAVNVGIHPRIRAKVQKEDPRQASRRRTKRYKAKRHGAKWSA